MSKQGMERPVFFFKDEEHNDLLKDIVFHDIGFDRTAPHGTYPNPGLPPIGIYTPETGRVIPDYQLVYIVHGQGTVITPSRKTYHVKAGSVIVVFADVWHSYYPDPETGWSQYWIGFNGQSIRRHLPWDIVTPEHPTFEVGINNELIGLFERALKMSENKQWEALTFLVGFLLSLMKDLSEEFHQKQSKPDRSTRIREAMDYMRHMTGATIDLQQIAAELGMSYSTFRSAFKQIAGISPHQYFLQARLGHAADLLRDSKLSIKEIAFRMGYDSPSHFCTSFQRLYSITPQQFRQDHGVEADK